MKHKNAIKCLKHIAIKIFIQIWIVLSQFVAKWKLGKADKTLL